MTQREGESHLLYVDSDSDYRREVTSVFEPAWMVTTAPTVEEAMTEIDTTLDCIVAADRLPETDGLAFFQTIEADTEDVPFVLFAAHEDVDLLRAAFRAGITDVIYKQRSPGVTTDSEGETNAERPSIRRTEIADGIVGLQHRLDALETKSADLNGITLDVSRSLMGAAPDEVDMKTEWALQSLAEEIDANQCLIYEADDDMSTLNLTHGWSDAETADGEPHREVFGIGKQSVATDDFPGFGAQLQQFEPVCVDVTELTEAPSATDTESGTPAGNGRVADTVSVDTESLTTSAEVGTLLALPVVIEWQLSGTIVITVDQPREWGEDARQRLQAVGELVGHMERRRRQRQELERQNEQLEQFASVISHDLQNPLNVISGYLDLAMETGNLDRLGPAVDAAGRMEEMLEDLLTLAREGRAVGETEEVDLAPIITEAWESVETYEATLDISGFEEFEPVMADGSRLQEAFENLFKNAIVHAGEDVSMQVGVDDGIVYVADDGPGIPEDKRDVVFEYGHTGGNGTGLGLAIVRSIIEGHDWEVSAAESKTGGARFDIDLGR